MNENLGGKGGFGTDVTAPCVTSLPVAGSEAPVSEASAAFTMAAAVLWA